MTRTGSNWTCTFGAETGPHCRVAFRKVGARRKAWVYALVAAGAGLYWREVNRRARGPFHCAEAALSLKIGAEPVVYYHDGAIVAPGLPT